MGALASYFRRKDTTLKGAGPRLINVAKNNYRGLLGFFVPLCALSWQIKKGVHHITVQCMWIWIFLSFLFQPVNIPVTGLIPIFILPMAGAMNTVDICGCYMNDGVVLFILSGMLLLLMNNSGVDRRISMWLLCSGDNCQFSGKRLVFKCSTAAFFLSMFCNRLIVSSTLTQYVTPAFINLQSATSRYRSSEPCYDEMRYIVNSAIQTASTIGSTAVVHAALTTLVFRAMFYESAAEGKEYPDIFNYFQYSVYAFPVAFLMFILNFAYHMLLINVMLNKPMSPGSMTFMRNALLAQKKNIPRKVSLHERLTVIFVIFYLLMFFLRWSKYLDNKGWGDFRKEKSSPEIPGVKDATVAAMFVIALHILPKGIGFLDFLDADKKSELPPLKAESGIMWWRFVDKNLNYGYIFLFGTGVAILAASRKTGLDQILTDNFGKKITGISWNRSLCLVCFVSVALANVMPGVAACVVWLPFVLNMSLKPTPGNSTFLRDGDDDAGSATEASGGTSDTVTTKGPDAEPDWVKKRYLGALAVGVGTAFGFMTPFMYTPAYFCHHTGKVPKIKMAKYGSGSVIICFLILWGSLCKWAPYLWDPKDAGIFWVNAPNDTANATSGGSGSGGSGGSGSGGSDSGGGDNPEAF